MTAGQRRVKQKHGTLTDDSRAEKGQKETRNLNRCEPGREGSNRNTDRQQMTAGQRRVKQKHGTSTEESQAEKSTTLNVNRRK